MTLHVHALEHTNPADRLYFPAIARVHLAAWLTMPLMKTIYYGPAEAHPGYVAAMMERDTKAFKGEENCRFAVVLDDALPPDEELVNGLETSQTHGNGVPQGKVIAAIKYYFIDAFSTSSTPTAPSDLALPAPAPTSSSSTGARNTWPSNSHDVLSRDFRSHIVRARNILTSKLGAHVLVENLYTDPNHQHRGAGGSLIQHATSEADRRNLPCMLEAARGGIGVYEAAGFRAFGEGDDEGDGMIWFDLERWEGGRDKGVEFTRNRTERDGGRKGQGWFALVLMVRPAKAGNAIGMERDSGAAEEMGKREAAVV